MPLTYTIMPDLGMVYVRYWGVTSVQETVDMFAQFSADPASSPDLKHLVDLAGVVEYERSFPELMKLQAQKADTIMQSSSPVILVYYAPTRLSLTMARMILRSWDGLGSVVGRVAQTEEQALDMLGTGMKRFADLPLKPA